MLRDQMRKRLRKKAKKGFRGYPMATIAYYGPDSATASKVAASGSLPDHVPQPRLFLRKIMASKAASLAPSGVA
jgi:hypothetical protein